MNYEETWDTVYTILEEGSGTADHTTDLIMEALERLGEDILGHLEPPEGLQRWLNSHGLSLVPTREATPPKVWAILDGEEEDEGADLEEELGGTPPLQIGQTVEYRTAQSGPHNQSYVGSGRVVAIQKDGIVWVDPGPGAQEVFLDPRTDFIRAVDSP